MKDQSIKVKQILSSMIVGNEKKLDKYDIMKLESLLKRFPQNVQVSQELTNNANSVKVMWGECRLLVITKMRNSVSQMIHTSGLINSVSCKDDVFSHTFWARMMVQLMKLAKKEEVGEVAFAA